MKRAYYQCKMCRWVWEGSSLPAKCPRCLALASFLKKLSPSTVCDMIDRKELTFCEACRTLHIR